MTEHETALFLLRYGMLDGYDDGNGNIGSDYRIVSPGVISTCRFLSDDTAQEARMGAAVWVNSRRWTLRRPPILPLPYGPVGEVVGTTTLYCVPALKIRLYG